jgi:hypothetical protein
LNVLNKWSSRYVIAAMLDEFDKKIFLLCNADFLQHGENFFSLWDCLQTRVLYAMQGGKFFRENRGW